MRKSAPPDGDVNTNKKPQARKGATRTILIAIGSMAALVLWAHYGSGSRVFHSEVVSEPGWEKFLIQYDVD
jgi:hypothetical protein